MTPEQQQEINKIVDALMGTTPPNQAPTETERKLTPEEAEEQARVDEIMKHFPII
ncbi:hypothetical protein [Rufibacter sp. XAAS-G3-1]|uniref:hypothetical protein n=1 Tax=Rufibacter sp. XAAS-G3-1 TaxID=2729134 RepID=UPI0015E7C900|nr:hypothetical protein [Rufibacter sp. XAAS-G3-1]